jgi:peptidoglycan/LPS O-acetylase OafA/YrhL
MLPQVLRYSEIGSAAIVWAVFAITLTIALPAALISYRLLELPLAKLAGD